MTVERAIQIIHDNAVWDSVRPRMFGAQMARNATQNIVDAIMCAVAEEREACARIAREQACVGVEAAIRARGEK